MTTRLTRRRVWPAASARRLRRLSRVPEGPLGVAALNRSRGWRTKRVRRPIGRARPVRFAASLGASPKGRSDFAPCPKARSCRPLPKARAPLRCGSVDPSDETAKTQGPRCSRRRDPKAPSATAGIRRPRWPSRRSPKAPLATVHVRRRGRNEFREPASAATVRRRAQHPPAHTAGLGCLRRSTTWAASANITRCQG